MPAGIIIYNDHETVLIDDTYSNLSVRSKGTQASSPPATGVTAYRYTSLTLDAHSWWNFNRPIALGTYGLQVFDAAGNCTFDAAQQYARVVDVFNGPATGTITKTYTAGRVYAVVTAKRGLKTEQEVRPDPSSPAGWYNYRRQLFLARAYASGASIIAGWHANPLGEWSPPIQVVPSPTAADAASQFMVLDVTGY